MNPALLEKPASRTNVEIEGSKTGNEKNLDSSGYSTESGSKNPENVLPKLKPVPAEADLIPPKTYKQLLLTIVVVTDQNFPAVLPSAESRCLAIMRMEQASMDDLADMFIKIEKQQTFKPALLL